MVTLMTGDYLMGRNPSTPSYRVVQMLPGRAGRQQVILHQLGVRRFPRTYDWAGVSAKIESTELRHARSRAVDGLSEKELSTRHKTIRDGAWKRISPAVSGGAWRKMLSMSGTERTRVYQDLARKSNVDEIRIREDLLRFWAGGCTKEGLTPKFHGLKKRRKLGENETKRGRKRLDGLPGIQLSWAKRRQVEKFILRTESSGISVDEQYLELIAHFWSTPQIGRRGELMWIPLPDGQRLSKAQHKSIRRSLHARNLLRRRKLGQRDYLSKVRSSAKTWDGEATGPGAIYQLDLSGTQVELVSCINRRKRISTAIFGLAIDAYSKRIVGFCLTISQPKWEVAATVLYYAISSKKAIYKRYGIVDDAAHIPALGKPLLLIWDRGSENTGEASDSLAVIALVDSMNTRRWHGSDKPHVERAIGTFKTSFFKTLTGWRKKGGTPRGARNPKKDAALTLFEVTQLFLAAVLRFNRNPIPLESMPADARRAGVRPTPNDIWEFGVKNAHGALVGVSPARARADLLRWETAKITKKGVTYGPSKFTCDEFERLDMYSAIRESGPKEILVGVDEMRPDILWYRDSKHRKSLRLRRIDPSREHATYFPHDYSEERSDYLGARRQVEKDNFPRNFQDFQERKRVNREAVAEQRKLGPGGGYSKTEKVRANRASEKSLRGEHGLGAVPSAQTRPKAGTQSRMRSSTHQNLRNRRLDEIARRSKS